ncbi:chain length determinant protein EpsF [Massilia sp. W12]|uniref:chain length determinant protein EpsF n=1 Tax=Massilia sp. W12 TaxID=3126507 RepID=UPI0030CAF979
MNFSQLFLILRAHLKISLITLIVTVSATLAISMMLPKSYKASTSLVLNYKGVDPVTGMTLPAQLMPGYMATQVDIISSMSVSLAVVDELRWADEPVYKEEFMKATKGNGKIREWLAEILLKGLIVEPSKESSVLTITYKSNDPDSAARVANMFAEQYQKMSVQLKVDPLKKAATFFTGQLKVLRDNLESAQKKLSTYQQENNLYSVDNRLDVETTRLNDLGGQLVLAQAAMAEATSRQQMAKGANPIESPDVGGNPLVQNMRISLATAEAKFSEVAQRLDKNHPQYQSAKAEVDKLRSALAEHIAATSNSVSNNARIMQQREAEIRAALSAQKTKILELNRTRDQMNLLMREVESAQRAYDTASQRFTQANLEGQSNQSDIAVLAPAVPPLDHSSPRIVLNVALSIFIGGMLGIGFGLLAEMMDRRVRSATDLVNALEVPVMGQLSWGAPNKRRMQWLRKLFSRKSKSSAKGERKKKV